MPKVFKNIDDFLASDEFKGGLFDAARQNYEKEKAAGNVQEEEPPYLYQKGDKVSLLNPKYRDQKDWQEPHEVLGFYKGGEIVDENTASPYNTGYDVRIRNSKTGEEYGIPASYLRRL